MVILKTPNGLRRYCSLILFLLLIEFTLQAQNFGEFTGVVEDASGAVISGATVSASNTDKGQTRQVLTNCPSHKCHPYAESSRQACFERFANCSVILPKLYVESRLEFTETTDAGSRPCVQSARSCASTIKI